MRGVGEDNEESWNIRRDMANIHQCIARDFDFLIY